MESFSRGDVVKVPFARTGRATRQWRPALVISDVRLHDAYGLAWVLMITSAENRGWPDDVAVRDLASAGLPAPSVVRTAKIATIDSAAAGRIGVVSAAVLAQVMKRVGRILGGAG